VGNAIQRGNSALAGAALPSRLPRTGEGIIALLAVGGLIAIGTGIGVARLARRRTDPRIKM
jgi:LPXTG-motif cell wall-anchored protein